MSKRKPASSSKPRAARGGHSAAAAGRVRNVSRVTKSKGTKGPDPSSPTAPGEEAVSSAFALSAECMVPQAASLKKRLAPLLEEPLPVTLDINALQRIDTAGLQVITAFVRERAARGRVVEWQGTAPVLATAARLLGLTSLLKLPA
jgi:ABC-type transporter Mla MlaB component